MRGPSVARRLAGRLRTRLTGGRLILMYHRVTEVESDPWGLCVSPQWFAEHLQVLRRYGVCMTMGDMVRRLDAGRLPRRAVAVTFDDGYADNLLEAKPLLEQYDVPATFFLSTDLLDGRREFWWDELERIVIRPGQLPPDLTLDVDGKPFKCNVTAGATLTAEDYRQHRRWNYLEPPPTERHALYLELWALLKPIPDEQRRTLLAQLAVWAGAPDEPRASHRPLSTQEAAALGSGGLVEIGAHTLTHPMLPAQPLEVQRTEIINGKAACEVLWGRAVTSFSYPFGDNVPATVELVRDAGLVSACSTRGGRIRRGTDRFQLPRLAVGNWDGAGLARRLAWGAN